MRKKFLSDVKISEITGICVGTLRLWKKDKTKYKYKIYRLLKTSEESLLREKFKDEETDSTLNPSL